MVQLWSDTILVHRRFDFANIVRLCWNNASTEYSVIHGIIVSWVLLYILLLLSYQVRYSIGKSSSFRCHVYRYLFLPHTKGPAFRLSFIHSNGQEGVLGGGRGRTGRRAGTIPETIVELQRRSAARRAAGQRAHDNESTRTRNRFLDICRRRREQQSIRS